MASTASEPVRSKVEASNIKQLFADRASRMRASKSESSKRSIIEYGGEPASMAVRLPVPCIAAGSQIKGAVGADSELSILESCERGEDSGIARYRKALKQELPADVRAVVEQQAAGAQRNHDQIRDLRNAARARD